MISHSDKIELQFSECNSEVSCNLFFADKQLFTLERELMKKVRVPGFRQPRITKTRILDVLEREKRYFDNDMRKLLDVYIRSRENETSSHIKEIRKSVRKIIIASENLDIALDVYNNME